MAPQQSALCVLFLLVLLGQGEAKCEEFWKPFQGHCYYFSPVPRDWHRADFFCSTVFASKGATLVQDASPAVSSFLNSKIREISTRNWLGWSGYFWMGLRVNNGTLSSWADGTARESGYSRWKGGQPSTERGRCVVTEVEGWSLQDCRQQHPSICQAPDPDAHKYTSTTEATTTTTPTTTTTASTTTTSPAPRTPMTSQTTTLPGGNSSGDVIPSTKNDSRSGENTGLAAPPWTLSFPLTIAVSIALLVVALIVMGITTCCFLRATRRLHREMGVPYNVF